MENLDTSHDQWPEPKFYAARDDGTGVLLILALVAIAYFIAAAVAFNLR